MTKRYDLVVLGTGSAASTVASRCRAAGWRVAMIDSRPFGGTCALRGCDPKKVLIAAAEAVDWNRRLEGWGIGGDQPRIDWRELIRFKRSFTEPVPKQREASFARAGIVAFHGRARFVGPTTVHVVIATGATPARIGIPGEGYLVTSDQFLELDELPRRIAFVGGGYISFEFAHVAARASAQVTILHRDPRPLVGFDPDLVDRLVQKSLAVGIDVQLNTEVVGIEQAATGFTVHTSRSGARQALTADLVVHGAGRVPEIDDLDLPVAGVDRGPRGIKVNEFLQSVSNPAVYAAGDAAQSGGPPLTPVAGYEGKIVAANLLQGNHLKPDYSGIPTVVFTIPPMASVGLHEQAARAQNLRFRVNHQDTSGWYSSRRVGEDHSGFKVLIDEDSGRILGAHVLGPHAEEIINLFALAIRRGLSATDLKETVFAYPTHASDIQYML